VGDPVRCVDTHNNPVAVGLTNFSSDDLLKIKGMRSDRIVEILGTKESDEVMHRDNLVIL
jgi:glutamate 5-kinase